MLSLAYRLLRNKGNNKRGVREWGGGDVFSMHGDCKAVGARARAERTWNIRPMSVTLDLSKLSGWLTAVAPCRVERRECDVEGGTARK